MPRRSPLRAPYLGALSFFLLQTALLATEAPTIRCGFLDGIQRHSSHGGVITAEQRPTLPFKKDSPSGNIRVHYATTGVDAVPPADMDGTGVPDYVEEAILALEYALSYETGTLGYLPPPGDDTLGGSDALDVYLRDMSKDGPTGSGVYGSLMWDVRLAIGPPEKFSSWIEVDNDFSPNDRNLHGQPVFATTGIDGLKVTTAHELHHAIQIGSYGLTRGQEMVYEMTSTWMEMAVWPSLRDWATYMEQLLKSPELYPFSIPDGANGYTWGWYGAVLNSYEDKHILRKCWERIALGDRPFEALVNASGESGVPFEQMFCDALGTLYRTGSRGRMNPILRRADSLPEIRLQVDQAVKAPSEIVTGLLRPYDVRAMRFSVPSVVDPNLPVSVTLMLTWPDNEALIAGESNRTVAYDVTLTASPTGSDTPLNGTGWGVRVNPPEVCFRIEGIQTERTESPYPMPIIYGQQSTLSVPIPSAIPGDLAIVTLHTDGLVALGRDTYPVALDDTRIVINWTVPPSLRPGVYLLNVECAGTTTLHKIIVR